MRILDISMPITENMNVYKDNAAKRPVITLASDFSTGSTHETKIEMNVHTGTHIDMPLHILENGKTIENMDLEKVLTKCKVFDFTHVEEKISVEHLTTPVREKYFRRGLHLVENEKFIGAKSGQKFHLS